jgi:uncharacterized protein YcbX
MATARVDWPAMMGARMDRSAETTGAVVSEIALAVVKGTRLTHPRAVEVGPDGLVDDRRFHVVTASGRQQGATKPRLTTIATEWDAKRGHLALHFPDGATAAGVVELGGPCTGRVAWDGNRPIHGREVVGPWADALSEHLGARVKLVEAAPPRRAIDVAPVTLVSDGSIARLEAELGARGLGSRRFRLNLFLEGLRAHEEDEWYGRRVRVGDCALRVTGAVPRCAVVTRDPLTGVRDHAALAAIVAYRDPVRDPSGGTVEAPFGVYAEVEEPGVVAAGDGVRL